MPERGTAVLVLWLCLAAFACGAPPARDLDRVLADLHGGHWQVRASAAETLGGRSDVRAVPALRHALHDDSAEVRDTALIALARLNARSALDDIRERIASDDEPQVVVEALFAFGSLGGGETAERQRDIDLLVSKLSDDAERVDSAARRVLFKLHDRRAFIGTLREDLRSSSSDARRRGSSRARALKLPELSGWERDVIRDPDPIVRRDAYASLGRHPKRGDLAILLDGLKDASPAVRLEAAAGLNELDEPASLAALEGVVGGDVDAGVRAEAAAAAAWIRRVPGFALPALWHFEKIADRVAITEDGACTLERAITVAIDRSPEAIPNLKLLLPVDFPRVDRVLDSEGRSREFTLESDEGFHYLVLQVPPIFSGAVSTFTLFARSRRPLTALAGGEILLSYAPAPVQARVGTFLVRIEAPNVRVRGISPPDLKLDAQAAVPGMTVARTELSPGDVEKLVVRVALPAAALNEPRTLPRSYSRHADLAAVGGLVAVILAGLAAAIVRIRRGMGERGNRAILVLALTTGALFLLCPILLEDNLPYYAVARSAVIDGDLDRMNEFSEFNQTQAYAPDARGSIDPIFGSAFRIPFVAAAHGLTALANASSPRIAPNGFSFPYLFITSLGDFLAVLIGCLACVSLVERRVGGRHALLAVLAVVLGTNLLVYAYAWTGSSFQPSFLLFAVFLNHWDKTRTVRTPGDWLLGGLLLGMLGITRTLNLGFAVIPLLDWLYTAAAGVRRTGARGWARHFGCGALLATGMLAGFAPQLVLQRLLDRAWFVDSYGVGTGRFSGLVDHAWGLFFAHDGLFSAMPIFGFVVIGLIALIRHDRWLGTLVTAALAVQLFAIGSYEIYWGYFRYGTPYLVPCSPVFCLAMASLARTVHVRWGRWAQVSLWGTTALFAMRNGWCVLRQLADKMMGDWEIHLGAVDVAHRLLMLDRKLDGDVLRPSSELGCLLRELVGALRSGAARQLVTASLGVILLAAAAFVVYRGAIWISGGRSRRRSQIVVSVVGLSWLVTVSWLVALAARTDADYGYHVERQWDRTRELLVDRLEPGQTYSWFYRSTNPADRFSVITYLEGAASVPQGERVATVELKTSEAQFHYEIRAGVDTADFEIDRPESGAERAHTAPLDRVSFSWRVHDDSSHFYTAKAYRSVFTSPLPSRKTTLKVTSTLQRGTLAVVVATAREAKIPRDPSRGRWIADRR